MKMKKNKIFAGSALLRQANESIRSKKSLKILIKRFFSGSLSQVFLRTYILLLIFSFFVAILWYVFPVLETCLVMFGHSICAPAGIYIGLLLSMPGYLLFANILSGFPEVHWFISLSVVVAGSALVYLMIGLLIDKYRAENSYGRTKLIAITAFVMLLYLLYILY
jgi:hypothetical protein